MILVMGLYNEFGHMGTDWVVSGGFGQDLARIWGGHRVGAVRLGEVMNLRIWRQYEGKGSDLGV